MLADPAGEAEPRDVNDRALRVGSFPGRPVRPAGRGYRSQVRDVRHRLRERRDLRRHLQLALAPARVRRAANLRCAWSSAGAHHRPRTWTRIAAVAGKAIANMADCRELVLAAHLKLKPGVPLVGWDVAIDHHRGHAPLEANLSCTKLFRAATELRRVSAYDDFIEEVMGSLETGE